MMAVKHKAKSRSKSLIFITLIVVLMFVIPHNAQGLSKIENRHRFADKIVEKTGVSPDEFNLELIEGAIECGDVQSLGCYEWNYDKDFKPTIRVTWNTTDDTFEFVLLHELGHHKTVRNIKNEEYQENAANKYALDYYAVGRKIEIDVCMDEDCFSGWTAKKSIQSATEYNKWIDAIYKIYNPEFLRMNYPFSVEMRYTNY